jgi:hypothetical protein
MIDALMYGVIDNEKTVACESAPPVIVFRYSRKFPSTALLSIHVPTVLESRKGTVTALPNLKMIIMSNVYNSFLRISGTLHARLSV